MHKNFGHSFICIISNQGNVNLLARFANSVDFQSMGTKPGIVLYCLLAAGPSNSKAILEHNVSFSFTIPFSMAS